MPLLNVTTLQRKQVTVSNQELAALLAARLGLNQQQDGINVQGWEGSNENIGVELNLSRDALVQLVGGDIGGIPAEADFQPHDNGFSIGWGDGASIPQAPRAAAGSTGFGQAPARPAAQQVPTVFNEDDVRTYTSTILGQFRSVGSTKFAASLLADTQKGFQRDQITWNQDLFNQVVQGLVQANTLKYNANGSYERLQ